MLELAVLGLLHDSPMHGYQLRKHLVELLGALRAAFSYGSLYPTLRRMRDAGWIVADDIDQEDEQAPPLAGRRGRISYRLTPEGKERFASLLASSGPESYEDSGFGVRFAFFSRCDQATRLRVLEGRRLRVEERRQAMNDAIHRTARRLDNYSRALQQHGLDACEREVRWLNELIASEQAGRPPSVHVGEGATETDRD